MESDASELHLDRAATEQELEENQQSARDNDPILSGVDNIYGAVNDKFIPQFEEKAKELQENAVQLAEQRMSDWQKGHPKATQEELEKAGTDIQAEVEKELSGKIQTIQSTFQKKIDNEANQTIDSFLGIEKEKAELNGPSRLASALGEFARPFYKIPGTLIKGAGIITPDSIGGDDLKEFGTLYNKVIDELIPTNPEFAGAVDQQLSAGLGQVASLIMTGGLTGSVKAGTNVLSQGLTKQGTKALVLKSGENLFKNMTSAPATVGSMQMAVPEFEAAVRGGATDEEALEVFVKNAVVGGILEQAPVMQFFKRMNQATKGGIVNWLTAKGKSAFTGGFEEGITEMMQGIYSNQTAKDTYDTTVKILDGVMEEGSLGFGVGFIINAIGANVKTARQQNLNDPWLQKAEDLIDDKKAQFESDTTLPRETKESSQQEETPSETENVASESEIEETKSEPNEQPEVEETDTVTEESNTEVQEDANAEEVESETKDSDKSEDTEVAEQVKPEENESVERSAEQQEDGIEAEQPSSEPTTEVAEGNDTIDRQEGSDVVEDQSTPDKAPEVDPATQEVINEVAKMEDYKSPSEEVHQITPEDASMIYQQSKSEENIIPEDKQEVLQDYVQDGKLKPIGKQLVDDIESKIQPQESLEEQVEEPKTLFNEDQTTKLKEGVKVTFMKPSDMDGKKVSMASVFGTDEDAQISASRANTIIKERFKSYKKLKDCINA